jgi:hypothetical protein
VQIAVHRLEILMTVAFQRFHSIRQ